MTREEAIAELKLFKGHTFIKTEEAIDMAIEALEKVSKLQRLIDMFKQEGHRPIRTISMEDLQEFIK